jgi:HK97 family phage prohead protease
MFSKSWSEHPVVDFLLNHDPRLVPGTVVRTWEDDTKAYSELKFGNWTLGNDVLMMAEGGVIKGVSFGYSVEKKDWVNIRGKKVRELKEVYHGETSLLTVLPANPLAQIVSITKDADGVILELKDQVMKMERFCRDSKASDDTIKMILDDLLELKAVLNKFDTGDTPTVAKDQEQSPSEAVLIKLLNLKF